MNQFLKITALALICACIPAINAQPTSQDTVLFEAVLKADVPATKAALAAGANPHICNTHGHNLMDMILNKSLAMHDFNSIKQTINLYAIAELLLDRSVFPTMQNYNLLLHNATTAGNSAVARHALAKGADATTITLLETIATMPENLRFDLEIQYLKGRYAIAALLFERDVVIHNQELLDQLLFGAALVGNPGAALHLLTMGADPDAVNNGLPLLCFITASTVTDPTMCSNRLTIARELLHRGACVHATDQCGNTPLHHAIWQRQPALIALLCEHGAQPHVCNRQGKTPLDFAKRQKLDLALLQRSRTAHVKA